MLAGRVKLLVDDVAVSEAKVRAIWTDDDAKSTRISPELAHYTGQEELSRAIDEAFAARRDGDEDTATAKFGNAVRIASEHGDTHKLRARWRPWSRSSKPRPVRCAPRSTSTSSTASPSKRARSRPTAWVEGAMSTICPRGHPSADHRLLRPVRRAAWTPRPCRQDEEVRRGLGRGVVGHRVARGAAPPTERCPRCQTPRVAGDRYCEDCGHDFEDRGVERPASWVAVVAADRAHFDLLAPDDIEFPDARARRGRFRSTPTP